MAALTDLTLTQLAATTAEALRTTADEANRKIAATSGEVTGAIKRGTGEAERALTTVATGVTAALKQNAGEVERALLGVSAEVARGMTAKAEELTANIILLFGAGHETTVNLIGNGLLALHRNPDQLALLKSNPALITNAIEEFLRYDSSVQMTGRVALEDIEDLGGRRIPKGESVLCLLGSANRDPAVYPDRPDRLDITRPNVRPLSFGGGIHFCLGAQLARIEAEIAISTLLRRLPELRLDDAENPEWRPTFVLRGLKALPASW